jgi:hypothetical protein
MIVREANRVHDLTTETTILVSTSFLSEVVSLPGIASLPETPRCLAEFHGPI